MSWNDILKFLTVMFGVLVLLIGAILVVWAVTT